MSGEITWILCSGMPATRAYTVRWACGAWLVMYSGQLAGHRVHVGHRPARLHRRRVRARVEHVEGDGDVGGGEGGVRGRLVAGLPVEDVVVGAALDLVADERGVGVERPPGVDHRRQRLVLDVDQLQRVARRVAVLGDDEGDLLALVAHLVGGEHGLHVGRQRRHPGQLQAVEHRPVITAWTFGCASAADVSIDTMRAWA